MSNRTPITVAYGDGIGPEIMEACLNIMEAAGAQLEIEEIEIGEKVYLSGNTSGIEPSAWDSLRRTGVFFKAPITTPQGGGYKSINVTMRKTLGLYANVRPMMSYHPFVKTKHPKVDLVIVRENEEDLYAGIEHRQTQEVYQTLKLITHPGSERIVRYAFEYARRNNRKKVTCFTKDNIMKMTDGLFHKIFDQIGEEYPEIEKEHWIIDIGAAKAATEPEAFDVIVMPNLYGDVVSDITAQLTGSVGLAGSANIGEKVAMFEAIHGSAPDIAGLGIANPSGLLIGGVLMLMHIGQNDVAEKVRNAWLKTIEDGIHTGDIYKEGASKKRVNTKGFTDAVIERLGQRPVMLTPVNYSKTGTGIPQAEPPHILHKHHKELVGVDLFLDWDEDDRNPDVLAAELQQIETDGLKLVMITNRGQKVWPQGAPETFCTDHWRCRFQIPGEGPMPGGVISHQAIVNLLQKAHDHGFDFIKMENLYTFDGELGFSLGQGQ
ncbi:MAG: isocitrate dehydrogenase [Phototrophicales bacterium]|nr:MAG: isocitrate dehydrogenase [Phototrophicales bacterium]RMG71946.1 MAG: NADP-dependent isocitrate dehydrogenase [Chloroflexota bacterium]